MANESRNPIDEKFLDVGDLFGLQFSNGAVFGEVTGTELLQYKPYSGVDEVQGGGTTQFTRLEDDGDDILHIEPGPTKVLHGAIGISSPYIRRYTNYPEDQIRLRTPPNLQTPNPGSDYGYVDGRDSPFDDPSTDEELFIPPGVHLNFAFSNADNKPHKPYLNIKFKEYNFRPLNPGNSSDRNAIKRITSPGSPMPIAPVGSIDQQDIYRNSNNWGVNALSNTEVARIRMGDY